MELSLEQDGQARLSAASEFDFQIGGQDREDLRWYYEDYLQYPVDPAPKIAARIEKRLAEIGSNLFEKIFYSDEDMRDLWATIRAAIDDARIEVVSDVEGATAIPWELLRDPKTGVALALRARAFVRTHPNPAERPRAALAPGGRLRILLVICRPRGARDVPFRSVASRVIKAVGDGTQQTLELEVLRPPTFQQLSKVLRRAKLDGTPYQVVHFDGHGVYAEGANGGALQSLVQGVGSKTMSGGPGGKQGMLLFENPADAGNSELVDGRTLGSVLVEAGVSVLVLNACRSAHADPPAQPEQAADDSQTLSTHERVRAFGSLAQVVMDSGVPSVVAMRYNVYVVTAAQFVADLYTSLVAGDSLGVAVTGGRKQLAASPLREVGFTPCTLQDWAVPVVYEAAPIRLFEKPADPGIALSVNAGQFEGVQQALQATLPPRPDTGFFGRDETILALDRAFDTQNVVLLHAYAGHGKTSTAAEFARWYSVTGGMRGPVLFTSFQQYLPLARVLDQIGTTFSGVLEANKIHWLSLADGQRRQLAVMIMKQMPLLWIWDNVEPVCGFPAGTPSVWHASEQQELKEFLNEAVSSKAKFLLTSRRDEMGWLGNLPARVELPPMPLQERVWLARGLAEKYGRRLTDLESWIPLLEFTQGNPLTVTVVTGQALREGLHTREEIEAFVARLRAGAVQLKDDEKQGRSRSLGASLSYGFQGFSPEEQRILAVLHLFQGIVDAGLLALMPGAAAGQMPEITRDDANRLLDRAAEGGLLTKLGERLFTIHPALPWYFKNLFESSYADGLPIIRAYVHEMARLGVYFQGRYGKGERSVFSTLRAQEQNLLHAMRLGREHGWWQEVVSLLEAFENVYKDSGRGAEFKRLLASAAEDFIDPATDDPLPSKEDFWARITGMRARQATADVNHHKAERLHKRMVEDARQKAAAALAMPPDRLDAAGRSNIEHLSGTLHNYGILLQQMGKQECMQMFEESLQLSERIHDFRSAAKSAYHLGHAYSDFPGVRSLDKAEYWYSRKLELETAANDRLGQAMALHELGQVRYARFQEMLQRGASTPQQLAAQLQQAADLVYDGLKVVPPEAIFFASHLHHLLGNIYDDAGQVQEALRHYTTAIQISEQSADILGTAKLRREVARLYFKRGQLADAMSYALAARDGLAPLGADAGDSLARTNDLIANIQRAGARGAGGQR